jgi:hypothetical protein
MAKTAYTFAVLLTLRGSIASGGGAALNSFRAVALLANALTGYTGAETWLLT